MDQNKGQGITFYYSEFETEVLGPIWLAATDTGLCTLRFDEDVVKFITNLAKSLDRPHQPNIIHKPEKTTSYLNALQAYCEKKIPIPENLSLDLSALTDFQQQILNFVRGIPFGATTTYGEIADAIQNPNASRAIGQVLRRNPIPIIIPCHRVLSADGTLGGYGGVMGSERKIALLKHEGIILA